MTAAIHDPQTRRMLERMGLLKLQEHRYMYLAFLKRSRELLVIQLAHDASFPPGHPMRGYWMDDDQYKRYEAYIADDLECIAFVDALIAVQLPNK